MITQFSSQLASMQERKPELFSPHSVTIDSESHRIMDRASHLITEIMARPAFIEAALTERPEIAAFDPGNLSAMIGFDYHLTDEGPRLIEINTNAGGLMTSLLWRLRDDSQAAEQAVARMVAMFSSEYADWCDEGCATARHIAIVDRDPFAEYTIDDFHLTRIAFEDFEIEVTICRTDQLQIRDGRLYATDSDTPVDLVYNRSCDFYLEEAGSQVLDTAYREKIACITPNPRGYALLSDKRSLALLHKQLDESDCGLSAEDHALVRQVVLPTHLLAEDPEHFAEVRNSWFFKPINLHAGIGAFRGDKLSRKRLATMNPDEYIVQQHAKPTEVAFESGSFKYDVRYFTHQNITIDLSCRLYQGRITNFRTPEGGYTAVLIE